MNSKHRSAINDRCVDIQRDLIIDDNFLMRFRQHNVLNENRIEEIKVKPTKDKRSYAFLTAIQKCGPDAFKVLVEALTQTGQSHIAAIIDPDGEFHDAPPRRAGLMCSKPGLPSQTYKGYDASPEPPDPKDFPQQAPQYFQSPPQHGYSVPYSRDASDYAPMTPSSKTVTRQSSLTARVLDQEPRRMNLHTLRQLSEDEEKIYPINETGQRGRAIILAIDVFSEKEGGARLNDREGSSRDVFNLQLLLTQLRYDVTPWTNLTIEDIKRKIESEKKRIEHKKHDSFLFVCMSHGSRGHIYDKNCKPIDLEKDIIAPFDAMNWTVFGSKPKLFFIQACQSDKDHIDTTGVEVEGDAAVQADEVHGPISFSPTIHEKSHIFTFTATVPGFKSYRDCNLGSWFIRDLVESIIEQCHEDDLAEIALAVKRKVNQRATMLSEYKQVPQDTSTLMKKFYFPFTGT